MDNKMNCFCKFIQMDETYEGVIVDRHYEDQS